MEATKSKRGTRLLSEGNQAPDSVKIGIMEVLRIGIDGSSILPRRTGIGHYTNQLLEHLARVDERNRYVVFLNSLRQRQSHEEWMDRENFSFRRYRIPGPLLLYAWRWLNRPRIDRFVGRVDVFHSPATYVPPQREGAAVTTVHDLYFLRRPEACELLGGRYLAATLPRRLRQLDHIIAASNSTRDDLVELLGVAPERITVVYEGVDSRFRPIADRARLDAVRARYGLPDRYILFVGTVEPRKNVERLVEAYAIVRREKAQAPSLVIVGGRGKEADRVDRLIESAGLGQWVALTGYVEHADLPALYNCADLFVLPSLYEGFGLPVLEAMACGVPVVAADTSSLRELVAGRGFLVDPKSASDIARGILQALSEKTLREEYVQRASDFARKMTWEQCARETLAVYQKVARERRSTAAARKRS